MQQTSLQVKCYSSDIFSIICLNLVYGAQDDMAFNLVYRLLTCSSIPKIAQAKVKSAQVDLQSEVSCLWNKIPKNNKQMKLHTLENPIDHN